jgi:hypothetical protein
VPTGRILTIVAFRQACTANSTCPGNAAAPGPPVSVVALMRGAYAWCLSPVMRLACSPRFVTRLTGGLLPFLRLSAACLTRQPACRWRHCACSSGIDGPPTRIRLPAPSRHGRANGANRDRPNVDRGRGGGGGGRPARRTGHLTLGRLRRRRVTGGRALPFPFGDSSLTPRSVIHARHLWRNARERTRVYR